MTNGPKWKNQYFPSNPSLRTVLALKWLKDATQLFLMQSNPKKAFFENSCIVLTSFFSCNIEDLLQILQGTTGY
jgi:hypothetical protein